MKRNIRFVLLGISCIVIFILAVGIGSVPVPPSDTCNVILYQLFGINPFGEVDPIQVSILWKIRIPRTFLAFLSGGGLAVSGVMMQSVLRNPLASSFTLGVSSGAALGAGLVIVSGISVLGSLTLSVFGITAGILTVVLALVTAVKIDRNLQNNSIILTGMAFSLFANAIITIMMTFAKEQLQRLIFWQMGSFSMKSAEQFFILLPILFIGFVIVIGCARQMDIMTLGEEQAQTTGVETKKMKWLLLLLSAVITGTIVSIAGIIGFVDLFTPHAARRLFGSSHKYVLPASILLGGMFMVGCDLAARTLAAPLELPVGAVTSAIGAPFFIYLYFHKRKKIV